MGWRNCEVCGRQDPKVVYWAFWEAPEKVPGTFRKEIHDRDDKAGTFEKKHVAGLNSTSKTQLSEKVAVNKHKFKLSEQKLCFTMTVDLFWHQNTILS